eukprot:TRINITY_DN3812_c0_g1_i1.p1 TRINITY_DN3812_c0_g1~~TRINITY_DN3812_c0_g1_i1.p1  ORF type:complete len:261 (+),score=29.52 TRINITY_DN3812_c0_g1_i1:91-873(+)
MAYVEERNQDATCYVGDLATQVDEAILWELFLQCGPVVNVHIPKDKLTKEHNAFGFVEFKTEQDADYAMKIMNGVKLYQKPIRVNKVWASKDKKTNDIGANLFIGSLDLDVDEKILWEVFSAFGYLINPPKIMRDESGRSKGFGFVQYDSFEAADLAIASMNGQWLMNKQITVQYALKKDSKSERHGSLAERILAANNPASRRGPPGPPMPFMGAPPMGQPGFPATGPPMMGQYPPMYQPGMPPPGIYGGGSGAFHPAHN